MYNPKIFYSFVFIIAITFGFAPLALGFAPGVNCAVEPPDRELDKPVAAGDGGEAEARPVELACEYPCRATDPESPLPEDAEEQAGRSDFFADGAIKLACEGTYCP